MDFMWVFLVLALLGTLLLLVTILYCIVKFIMWFWKWAGFGR